jgi:predicted pyridoxine 5'-phosphate oxidase superfamily flavin-nucleotide-binding protein
VSILVSKGFKSYEVKASVKDRLTSGPVFDQMSEAFKKMKFDLKGLWLLKVEEVWNQSPTYDAGKKMI